VIVPDAAGGEAGMSARDPDPTALDEGQRALFASVVDLLRRRPADVELTAAREELRAFLAGLPASVPGLRLLAEVALRLGDLEEARRCIGQAEQLDPWNLEILIISESLYGAEAAQRGRKPGAAPMPDSELDSGAITTEGLIEKAMGSFRLGQLERAYSLSKLAYRIQPQKGYHLLDIWTAGSALDPSRCRQELTLLADEEPKEPYLFLALGSVDNVLGLHEEAARWLEQGLALEPKEPYVLAMLLNELAYVLAKRGARLEEATRLARKALDVFPDRNANGFIRDTLGVVYLKRGDLEKAVRNLREAVAKDPTAIPRFHLGLALLECLDAPGSLAELRAVAAARPSLETPHVEETAILQRVQTHLSRIEDLLNLGGADDLRDAMAILRDLM
jgi:tetratricopeptide (TPR) repeat protein